MRAQGHQGKGASSPESREAQSMTEAGREPPGLAFRSGARLPVTGESSVPGV